MVCSTVPLVLPQASIACQLLVEEYVLPQVPAVVVAPSSITVAPPHVSLVVGGLNTGVPGHSTVPSPPWPPIEGAVVSITWMVCSTVPSPPWPPIEGAVVSVTWIVCSTVPLVLPQASIACQLLVEEYVLPQVPAVVVAPSSTTVAPPHVSEAVGGLNTGVPGHSTVPSPPWPPIEDAVVSLT